MCHLTYKSILTAAVIALVALLPPGAVSAQSDEENEEYRFYISGNLEQVESPTRRLQPISQVPDNVTTITKEQIKGMNAHSVSEILARVPGFL